MFSIGKQPYREAINFVSFIHVIYKYSTSHAIITLVDKVSRALDTGKFVIGLYLDIKKAFDGASHSILLEKLYALGIRGNIYNWFTNYLREENSMLFIVTVNLIYM